MICYRIEVHAAGRLIGGEHGEASDLYSVDARVTARVQRALLDSLDLTRVELPPPAEGAAGAEITHTISVTTRLSRRAR